MFLKFWAVSFTIISCQFVRFHTHGKGSSPLNLSYPPCLRGIFFHIFANWSHGVYQIIMFNNLIMFFKPNGNITDFSVSQNGHSVRFVCWFLSAGLGKTYWPDFHETWCKEGCIMGHEGVHPNHEADTQIVFRFCRMSSDLLAGWPPGSRERKPLSKLDREWREEEALVATKQFIR